jgi:hypothetical protein
MEYVSGESGNSRGKSDDGAPENEDLADLMLDPTGWVTNQIVILLCHEVALVMPALGLV